MVATGELRPARGGREAVLPPAGAPASRLALARARFLGSEPVPVGVVREPILASWTRSRLWGVAIEHLDVPYEPDLDDSALTRAAEPVLRDLAEQFSGEPVSVVLCDASGVVRSRRTGDRELERRLDRVRLAPGFSYAERHVGTNGIGTALEGGGPAQVLGHEHYAEQLEELACAGFPIRHPATRKVLGVIDLTCWRRDAGLTMTATAATVARRIEEALLEQSGRREHALLHDYLRACRHSRGAVLAVSEDLLILNDQARELLDDADQTSLLDEAVEALGSGRSRQLLLDLPSGLTARVQCHSTSTGDLPGAASGIVQVLPLPRMSTRATRPGSTAHPPAPSTAVGSAPPWTKCREAVDRHFRAREWTVLDGEPGTGKATLAQATHQSRTPAAHLRTLDAARYGPGWIAEVDAELEIGGGTLVLTHLDRLPAEGVAALADALEPSRESTDADRPWVVATVTRPGGDADLSGLLALFPRTVEVPPLRHHVDDVAELVAHLLARLTRGGALTCSPDALRVLMRNRWPGNVEQLHQVLRQATAKRRSGAIEVGDLPPGCRAVTRRVLSRLEALECDAIVSALLDTGGNKAEAARLVGMSRATIYRKVRDYGISLSA